MYTVWEVIPRRLPGATGLTRPGDPALDAWQLSEYQKAADVLSACGARGSSPSHARTTRRSSAASPTGTSTGERFRSCGVAPRGPADRSGRVAVRWGPVAQRSRGRRRHQARPRALQRCRCPGPGAAGSCPSCSAASGPRTTRSGRVPARPPYVGGHFARGDGPAVRIVSALDRVTPARSRTGSGAGGCDEPSCSPPSPRPPPSSRSPGCSRSRASGAARPARADSAPSAITSSPSTCASCTIATSTAGASGSVTISATNVWSILITSTGSLRRYARPE